jgi:hypothetical protein
MAVAYCFRLVSVDVIAMAQRTRPSRNAEFRYVLGTDRKEFKLTAPRSATMSQVKDRIVQAHQQTMVATISFEWG